MKKPKRKIQWEIVGGVIQIVVGLIEIGVIIFQCLTSKDEDEDQPE
jgi:hypothetical protein